MNSKLDTTIWQNIVEVMVNDHKVEDRPPLWVNMTPRDFTSLQGRSEKPLMGTWYQIPTCRKNTGLRGPTIYIYTLLPFLDKVSTLSKAQTVNGVIMKGVLYEGRVR